ncbi:MAG: tRNA lysidine(34) synthetase TilS [Dissulfurimicrobium sp.]|uniref:tRNA lysidine(34) synthetase TilS n=1 Tax=Dissulfurimicrobium sp. TaxID=2022436 RepID=UPI003D14C1EC
MLKTAREAVRSPILDTVRETITRHRLFEPGARILVGVSGGPDSICLLHILYLLSGTWDIKIEVAHFDHNLRGEESKRDARFVEEMAGRFMLPFHLGTGDVKAYARQNALCIQDAARALRYGFFKHVREKTGCTYIATGHTADDQAEEVLMRLLRGSGLAGLSGIPLQRQDGIIRPLLKVSKEGVLRHLAAFGLEFIKDSSNDNPKYLRNRIRKDLIPFLAMKFNPAIVNTLNRMTSLLSEEHQLLEDMAASAFGRALMSNGGCHMVFDVLKLRLSQHQSGEEFINLRSKDLKV